MNTAAAPAIAVIVRWARRLFLFGIGFVLIAAAAALLLWRGQMPSYTGTVKFAGLGAETEVLRDRNGIPHIFSASRTDAARALGYVHAQDRLFQMEMQRRAGAGRLSEVVGADALPYDKLFRTLGIYALAQSSYGALAGDARDILDAYTDGVNAWLDTHKGSLPLEFTLLGFSPEAWKPADTLVWGKLMAWRLSANYRLEAYRGRLAARYDHDKLERLFPPAPEAAPVTTRPEFPPLVITPAEKKILPVEPAPETPENAPDAAPAPEAPVPADEDHTDARKQLWRKALPVLAGMAGALPAGAPGASNEWVVSGARSVTGKPLLANDPHLDLETPILWYLARITTPEETLTGATVPGLPVVLLGQNGFIAWGFTTTNSDTQDLYIETIDPADPGSYIAPEGSRKFEVREEIIGVKGQDDVTLRVRSTRHGPVLSDIVDELNDDMLGAGQVVSLAFTGLGEHDRSSEALLRINQARNWQQFLDALAIYETPTQNMVYADREGNIGFINGGYIPVRKNGDGRFPADGTTTDGDWIGFVPFNYLPQVYNPPGGTILNANNAVVDRGYPYWLGTDYAAYYRAQRIAELLKAKDKFSVNDFATIQADTVSTAARDLMPFLLRLVPTTMQEKTALDLLRAWDFTMDKNRPEPLIFEWWLRQMNLRLLAGQLDEVMEARGPLNAEVVKGILEKPDGFCRTWEKRDATDCNHVVERAFLETLDELTHRYSPDIGTWRWGSEHIAAMENRVLGHLPGFNTFFGLGFSSGGGFYTVDRGGNYGFGDSRHPLIRDHGAGYRAVYDLGDPAKSRFMIATGQASHPFSPYYDNFLEPWQAGRSVTLGQTREELQRDNAGVMTFVPE
ncbi:MAG: penicillin acylase family protein [Alphaproteobacteria bacterium]|nr:penicillin acylase family protein [Alphaproteobacteria bacterium]